MDSALHGLCRSSSASTVPASIPSHPHSIDYYALAVRSRGGPLYRPIHLYYSSFINLWLLSPPGRLLPVLPLCRTNVYFVTYFVIFLSYTLYKIIFYLIVYTLANNFHAFTSFVKKVELMKKMEKNRNTRAWESPHDHYE